MVELPEEFMEVSVIKINPDGSKSLECVTGMKAAEESLKAGARAKANLAPGAPAAQPKKRPFPWARRVKLPRRTARTNPSGR